MQAMELQRFIDAQNPVYDDVCAELRSGRKTSHWMWFVFPQLKALGRSSTAKYYGIESMQEARAYLQHSLLGPRLRECTGLVVAIPNKSAFEIFGTPDDLKFRSCMTLFAQASDDAEIFVRALERFHQGQPDSVTLALLDAKT